MSRLFEPMSIGKLALSNRIVIAPMCQYSAEGGSATDWHMIHLGQLALSGAGMLILEATAVSPEGRISAGDLGLYSDENETALAHVLKAVRTYSPIAVAVQLAHAGRKGSSQSPWDGGAQIRSDQPLGWKTVAPSAVPHGKDEEPPAMLYDPRWPWHAAAKLGAQVHAPKQYWRSQPREYKDLFVGAGFGQR